MRRYTAEVLSPYLSKHRIDHSIRVATTAQSLAKHWHLNETQAWNAGLLHDIAKERNWEQVESSLTTPLPSSLKKTYQQYREIWHAFVAPYCLSEWLILEDPIVLDAVKWHTTGYKKMSDITQILYIADYIEPKRTLPYLPKLTELAFKNKHHCIIAISTLSILYLLAQQKPIHPFSLTCRNWAISQIDPKVLTSLLEAIYEMDRSSH